MSVNRIHYKNIDLTYIYILHNKLKQITIWLSPNKLTLNVIKSHNMYMSFHRSMIQLKYFNIEMVNTILQQVHFIKFKGVLIDDKLNYIRHIS